MAQGKRAGLITLRSYDRNVPPVVQDLKTQDYRRGAGEARRAHNPEVVRSKRTAGTRSGCTFYSRNPKEKSLNAGCLMHCGRLLRLVASCSPPVIWRWDFWRATVCFSGGVSARSPARAGRSGWEGGAARQCANSTRLFHLSGEAYKKYAACQHYMCRGSSQNYKSNAQAPVAHGEADLDLSLLPLVGASSSRARSPSSSPPAPPAAPAAASPASILSSLSGIESSPPRR